MLSLRRLRRSPQALETCKWLEWSESASTPYRAAAWVLGVADNKSPPSDVQYDDDNIAFFGRWDF